MASSDLHHVSDVQSIGETAVPGVPPLSVQRQAQQIVWTLAIGLAIFVGWAAYMPLDVASYAQGQVIPAGQIKRIQHLEGGIVSVIRVSEGQQVKAGDEIIELEAVSASSEVGDIRSRMGALRIRSEMLQALIRRRKELTFETSLRHEFPEFVRESLAEFQSEQSRYAAVENTYKTRMASRSAEISEAQERLTGLKNRAKLIDKQVQISENLLQKRLTSEYEHLTLKREQEQLVADRDTAKASQLRATRQMAEEEASLKAFRLEEEVKQRKNLQDVSTELASLKERFRRPIDSEKRKVVRAPLSGTIQTLNFKNKGSVVSPGGVVATLVPDGEALLIEAKLPIGDVGYVDIGQRARLSLATSSQGFSNIDAQIVHISPDSVVDDKTGQAHYIVRMKPLELKFHRGAHETYALRPGVQVMAAIVTGERSVLRVLLAPFMNNGISPLSERY